eukprot:TRINITY_DN3144_c0_g1_i1.p1 TRINITY_DN3144_c0_g1~~TRINITY_DN3144_c0_g1_i1.p1  ORF type:complete len:988 (+),score=189.66 TRINITY_DN3144_c0_g1_i1:438-2966(+)
MDTVVTFVDLVNIRSDEYISLYRHTSVIDCMGCSVNSDHTLIAFTARYRQTVTLASTSGESSVPTDSFESFVSELQGASKTPVRFQLSPRSATPQLVQFVPILGKQLKHQIETIAAVHGRTFSTFKVFTTVDTEKQVAEIVRAPVEMKVREDLAWFEWIPERSCLYVLYYVPPDPSRKMRSSKSRPQANYCLTCYSFKSKRAHVVFRTPIYISIGALDQLKIVRLRSGEESNIVLCQQHEFQEAYTGVNLSLYILHHQKVVKLSVALPSHYLKDARVFFDVMGDHLLIYIPGYFLQLVDCSITRPVSISLSLYGKKHVTAFPSQLKTFAAKGDKEEDDLPLPDPGSFITYSEPSNGHKRWIHSIFDREKGAIYRYTIDRTAILTLFEPSSPVSLPLRLRALRLSIITLMDPELVEEILKRIFSGGKVGGEGGVGGSGGRTCSKELLNEYLLGSTYSQFLKEIEANKLGRKRVWLPLLPYTSLPALGEVSEKYEGMLSPFDVTDVHFDVLSKSVLVNRPRFSILGVNRGAPQRSTRSRSTLSSSSSSSQNLSHPHSLSRSRSPQHSPRSSRAPSPPRFARPTAISASSSPSLSHGHTHTRSLRKGFGSNDRLGSRGSGNKDRGSSQSGFPVSRTHSLPGEIGARTTHNPSPRVMQKNSPTSPIHRFFGLVANFLSNENEKDMVAVTGAEEEDDFDTDPDREVVVSELAHSFHTHLTPLNSYTFADCVKFATLYRRCQSDVGEALFSRLATKVSTRSSELLLFDHLCYLSRSIEDLWWPRPLRFSDYFTALGYRCLSLSVFVRLMERGVFQVSVQFVEEVMRHLDNSPENIKLQHLLLHRLPQE